MDHHVEDSTASAPQQQTDAEPGEVTQYAYDPQTFEILCRPGQKLTPRKARRLQELGLYVHVIRSAE
jgi:hypothetical protein